MRVPPPPVRDVAKPLVVQLGPPRTLEATVLDEHRQPLAGVVLAPVAPDQLDAPAEVRAVSDAAGLSRFDNWPSDLGQLRLRVVSPANLLPFRHGIAEDDLGPQVELSVEPSNVRRGRVELADGTPVAGARVEVIPSLMVAVALPLQRTWTRGDGSFELRGWSGAVLAAPPTRLAGLAFALAPERRTGRGEPAAEMLLRLSAGGRAEIRVTDAETGEPVNDAMVSITYDGDPSFGTTAAGPGSHRFHGPPGQIRINAFRHGHRECRAEAELELRDGETTQVDLPLVWTAPRFYAEVVDRDGRPVPDAEVVGCFPDVGRPARTPIRATTDAAGRAIVATELTNGLHLIALSDLGCTREPVAATEDGTVRLVVDPTLFCTVAVKVADDAGAPIPGARVGLTQPFGSRVEPSRPVTGDDGTLLFGGLVPGAAIRFSVRPDGHDAARYPDRDYLTPDAGQRHTAVTIVCRRRLAPSRAERR